MNAAWYELASRVDGSKYAETFARVQSLIHQSGFRRTGEKPAINHPDEVLSLWQTRHQITKITGMSIPGVHTLIENLQKMVPGQEVEQYGFTGDKLAGSLFFNCQTGEFLGDTIVERRPKSQAMLDLEDQLIDPVSLARARSGSSRNSA